jgi:aspartate kinase
VTTRPAAVVCVIGSNMAIPGVLARATQVLSDNQVNVNCVSQSFRQVNMQFVVERSDYRKAIAALNHALCLGGKKAS